jgi:hypothetical protein
MSATEPVPVTDLDPFSPEFLSGPYSAGHPNGVGRLVGDEKLHQLAHVLADSRSGWGRGWRRRTTSPP